MASGTTTSFSGNQLIDGILWGQNAASTTTAVKWSGTSLTYSYSGYWNTAERAAVDSALDLIESVTGLSITQSSGYTDLAFGKYDDPTDFAVAYGIPPDPVFLPAEFHGIVLFNTAYTDYWNVSDLQIGGHMYSTVVHEIGHALGLAHPHDNGYLMPGVSSYSDTGGHALNQNVYTVMSYNQYGQSLSDGTAVTPNAFESYGFQTLGALDIAALQYLYGTSSHNTSSDTYFIPTTNGTGTYYQTIWDTGGTDTIRYDGSASVEIDLRAATLNTADGALAGGAVSKADGIFGGFTIANGVVIENATGGSGNDTLIGNAADNVLAGNEGNDLLDGGAGNDTVSYASSSQTIRVDLGDGTATGGHGSDTLLNIENAVGGSAGDSLVGSGGDNVLDGGAGNDWLEGGDGNDTLFGRAGWDEFRGGFGDDYLDGGDDRDYLHGGGGNDVLIGGGGNDTLIAGSGNDILDGGTGDDYLNGGDGFDTVSFASAGSRVVVNLVTHRVYDGSSGTDHHYYIEGYTGSSFDDLFYSSDEDEIIDAASGSDEISFMHLGSSVTVDLAAGTATGGSGNDTLLNFENVQGSGSNDIIYGTDADNVFNGGWGDDLLNGRGGIDIAVYHQSNSAIHVDFSTGSVTGGSGNDTLIEIEGVTGTNYDDVFVAGAVGHTIDGYDGNDTLSYAASTGPVSADLGAGSATRSGVQDTLRNLDNLLGSDFDDVLVGDHRDNQITGGDGNDTLSGGDGNDHLIGGAGNDILEGGAGTDILDGGAGVDLVRFSSSSNPILIDLINGTFAGSDIGSDTLISIEGFASGAGHDTFISGTGDDVLDGGAGFDVIQYDSMSSAVTVDLAAGTATGGGGNDTLLNFEHVNGTAFDDVIRGNAEDNQFTGGLGDDLLDGGLGEDTVWYNQSQSSLVIDLAGGTVTGDQGSDTLISIERAVGGNASDLFIASNADNILNGGLGSNTLSYAGAVAGVQATLGSTAGDAGTVTGGSGTDTIYNFENLIGSDYADTIIGNASANRLEGGAGDDILDGGGGNDALLGGEGNDTHDGGAGTDTVFLAGSADDYTFDRDGDGNLRASHSASGDVDTLINVEFLEFGSGETLEVDYVPLTLSANDVLGLEGYAFDGLVTHAFGDQNVSSDGSTGGIHAWQSFADFQGLVSGSGQHIAVWSSSENLVDGVNVSGKDAYIYDVGTDTFTLISDGLNGLGLKPLAISDDGNRVVVETTGNSVLAGVTDTNGSEEDIYLYTASSGTFQLINDRDVAGLQTSNSDYVSVSESGMSADGQFVVYSVRGNGDDGMVGAGTDANNTLDLYLFDADTGSSTLLSRSFSDVDSTANGMSALAFVSDDGRYVAFESRASDLVSGATDASGTSDIFLYDRVSDSVSLISDTIGSGLATTGGHTTLGSMSSDGRYLAVSSVSTDLVDGASDLNGGSKFDAFVYDRLSGEFDLLTASNAPAGYDTSVNSVAQDISDDGQFVLVRNHIHDYYIFDRSTDQATLVTENISVSGVEMSGNGRFVMFSSTSTDVIPDMPATTGISNTYVFDRLSGETQLLTASFNDESTSGNSASAGYGISDDGSKIFVYSSATDLSDGLTDNNGAEDIFVYSLDSAALVGGHGNDILTGNVDANELQGLDGNDTLDGGGGNDTLNGGTGTDTAILSGVVGDYIFDRDNSGNLRATHGASGDVDTFIDVETISFSDGESIGVNFVPLTLTFDATGIGAPRLVSHAFGNDNQTANGHTWGYFTSGGPSQDDVVSATGQYIAVHSRATDIGNNGGGRGAYLYDYDTNTFTLISPNSSAADITPYAISDDGNRVVVRSFTDLVSGGAGRDNLYLYTVDTDTFQQINPTSGYPQLVPGAPNTHLGGAEISADGRFVVFQDVNEGPIPPAFIGIDLSARADIYLFDADTGHVSLVSHTHNGVNDVATVDINRVADISADGRYVVFNSDSSNLRADVDDNAGSMDVYLYDRVTGENTLISDTPGTGLATSRHPTIAKEMTPDGRFILIESEGVDMVAGATDLNGIKSDVFVYDTQTDTIDLLTASNAPSNIDPTHQLFGLDISDDGRFVLIQGIGPGPGVSTPIDYYLYDRQSDEATLITHQWSDPDLSLGDIAPNGPEMSADGRYVMFSSRSTDVVEGVTDTYGDYDTFLYDHLSGTTTLLSFAGTDTSVASNRYTSSFGMSDDGSRIYIYTQATNIGDGITDANGTETDIYVFDLSPAALNGGAGNDTLTGTAQADTLNGLGGDDQLFGLDGDDILDGGAGNDTMTGVAVTTSISWTAWMTLSLRQPMAASTSSAPR